MEPDRDMNSEMQSVLTDEELARLLGAGDMNALGELYARYKGMTEAAIRRTARGLEGVDVDDLVHDVFCNLSTLILRYQDRQRFKAWLYGVAVNRANNWRRTNFLRLHLLGRHEREYPKATETTQTPLKVVTERETILKALDRLTEKQRQVMVLRAVEGFTGPEIAAILGLRHKTVKNRLSLARKALTDEPNGFGVNAKLEKK